MGEVDGHGLPKVGRQFRTAVKNLTQLWVQAGKGSRAGDEHLDGDDALAPGGQQKDVAAFGTGGRLERSERGHERKEVRVKQSLLRGQLTGDRPCPVRPAQRAVARDVVGGERDGGDSRDHSLHDGVGRGVGEAAGLAQKGLVLLEG